MMRATTVKRSVRLRRVKKKGTYLEPSRGNGRCRRQDVCELDVFEDVEHFFTRRANERLGFSDLW